MGGGRETPRLSGQLGASGGSDWTQAAPALPPPNTLPTSVLSPSVTVFFPAASQASISLSPRFLMFRHSESLTPGGCLILSLSISVLVGHFARLSETMPISL